MASEWVTCAAWSTDGNWLAAGFQDGTGQLWSTAPPPDDPQRTRPESADHQMADAEPDNRNLVGGISDVITDSPRRERWEEIFAAYPSLNFHGLRVSSLAWRPERSIVAVGAHTEIRVFDVQASHQPNLQHGINCLAWHPHRLLLVNGGMDGELTINSPLHPEWQQTHEAHSGGITAVAIAPDGEYLLSVGQDQVLLRWSFNEDGLDEPVALPCPVALPGALTWAPDGSWFAIGGQSGVVISDGRTGKPLRTLDVPDLVNDLALDPSGRHLAVATSGSVLTVRDLDRDTVTRMEGHLSSISAVAWPDENTVLSAGYDGQVLAWEPLTAQFVGSFDPGPGAVWDVALLGGQLLTVTAFGILSLHSIGDRNTICRIAFDSALSSCAASSDGWIATGGSAGTSFFRGPDLKPAVSSMDGTDRWPPEAHHRGHRGDIGQGTYHP